MGPSSGTNNLKSKAIVAVAGERLFTVNGASVFEGCNLSLPPPAPPLPAPPAPAP